MCLVEVTKSPKPVASCAMPAMPNMEIKVRTHPKADVIRFLDARQPTSWILP